jgi:hypothetical protein
MEEVFDMEKLECSFGGINLIEFNKVDDGQRVREDLFCVKKCLQFSCKNAYQKY